MLSQLQAKGFEQSPIPAELKRKIKAMEDILRSLKDRGYRFVTPTPTTHQRFLNSNPQRIGETLRDIFGWNFAFTANAVPPGLFAAMGNAGILEPCGQLHRSRVRVARIEDELFFHSSFPTDRADAVIFGPDTYRFARFLEHALTAAKNDSAAFVSQTPRRILDVGCGSGAGGILAVRRFVREQESEQKSRSVAPVLVCSDINPLALDYCAINARVANVAVTLAAGDALSAAEGEFDLIISNPPYMDDALGRSYRHGGAGLGRALSVRIVAEALPRLAVGGRLLLYTGVAIVEGKDPFRNEILPLLQDAAVDWSYAEIDPDVFGEELEGPAYRQAERIAAVGLVVRRRR